MHRGEWTGSEIGAESAARSLLDVLDAATWGSQIDQGEPDIRRVGDMKVHKLAANPLKLCFWVGDDAARQAKLARQRHDKAAGHFYEYVISTRKMLVDRRYLNLQRLGYILQRKPIYALSGDQALSFVEYSRSRRNCMRAARRWLHNIQSTFLL